MAGTYITSIFIGLLFLFVCYTKFDWIHIWRVKMELLPFLVGCSLFPALNVCVKKILFEQFGSKLTHTDRYVITEKCVCSIQAIMSTIAGIIIALSCQRNIMTDKHWLTNTYCVCMVPYFAYDTVAMYQTHVSLHQQALDGKPVMYRLKHYARRNIPMLMHHTILPFVFTPCIVYFRGRLGDYFVGVFYSFEVAIPFISVRFILAQLNKKDTVAYVIAGLLMTAVFFLSRVCIFPFLYWRYARFADIPLIEVPARIPWHCNAGCALILVFQLYFLVLMIKGTIRYVYKAYRKKIT